MEYSSEMMSKDIVPGSLHPLLEGRKWRNAEVLLSTSPSLAFESGSLFKTLPLVTALMNRPPLWLVITLINSNPAAVSIKSEYGMLPIRVAIRSKCSTDVINALIRENQQTVQSFGVCGNTCLHLACLYNGDSELVEKLLKVWPEATEWRDRDGWHPLHLACMCDTSPAILRKIIDAYPDAAAMPDSPEHQLPLHIAVSHITVHGLQLIYDAYPDAIKCHTKTRGFIPLHIACTRKNADADSIQFLLNKFKNGAMVQTKLCESLPIHLAARYGCPMNVIQMLVHAYPRGLHEKNSLGETPFTSKYTNEVSQELSEHNESSSVSSKRKFSSSLFYPNRLQA